DRGVISQTSIILSLMIRRNPRTTTLNEPIDEHIKGGGHRPPANNTCPNIDIHASDRGSESRSVASTTPDQEPYSNALLSDCDFGEPPFQLDAPYIEAYDGPMH